MMFRVGIRTKACPKCGHRWTSSDKIEADAAGSLALFCEKCQAQIPMRVFTAQAMKRVLVLEGHYQDSFYDVSTSELLYAAALTILKNSMATGVYLEPDSSAKEPELTRKQIEELPESSIKNAALAQWNTYEKMMARYEEDMRMFNMIQTAIKDEDGKLAWRVMNMRSDAGFEDESFTINHVED